MGNNKIRFLATGDFHSDLSLISRIKNNKNFKSIDFVILIGDLSDKKNDFKKLLEIFKGKNIFMVPGNHESKRSIKILEENYNIHIVGNNPVIVHDDMALFGSNYVPIGEYGVFEGDILENLIENYQAIADVKCKIQLSHLPPADTKISNASALFPYVGGSDAVRVFLEQFKPNMTLVGHIHESSGLEEIVNNTKVINVGRTFKIFEFDPKTCRVKEVK
ncbi:MAG: metallophosphoesterase family protein [Nanoarchaeota archaeon]